MVCCREWKVFYGFGLRVEVTGSKKLVRLFGDSANISKNGSEKHEYCYILRSKQNPTFFSFVLHTYHFRLSQNSVLVSTREPKRDRYMLFEISLESQNTAETVE